MGEGVVNGPGEGEALRNSATGRVALVKGALPHIEVFEFTIEGPFDGPDPHTHADQTDAFYVLEGEIDFHVDGREFRGGPGTYVAAPPGTPHGFKKHDTGTARFLNIHAPGVFLDSMRRMSDPPESASTEPGRAEDVPTADQMTGLDAFEELCDDLLARNPDLERTKMMGMPSLKRNGKLVGGFAASEDAMVFKLEDPAAHAEALALEGAHLFDPGSRGRPFKEWVVVPPALASHWPALAEKALGQVPEPIVVEPGDGEVIPPFGPVIKAASELSGGAFTVIEALLMPGESGPPMHLHRSHDESFYVIDGVATLLSADAEHDLGVGGYAFVPRGTPHTITNRSEDDAVRYLAIASGGLECLAAELREADDDDATRAVLERYETELLS